MRRQVSIGPWIENGFYYDFDPVEPFQEKDLRRSMAKVPPLGSARGRLPRLLRVRLTALAGSALPGERPGHWTPSHCLGCSS